MPNEGDCICARREVPLRMLATGLASLGGAPRGLAGDAAKPNFLVFFVDDLGIDQVAVPTRPPGFVGYTGNGGAISTPNVARLASEGMLFQNWYASFHVCSPSRASMVTGRYSIRSGVGVPKDVQKQLTRQTTCHQLHTQSPND